jgi:hypothetical protein
MLHGNTEEKNSNPWSQQSVSTGEIRLRGFKIYELLNANRSADIVDGVRIGEGELEASAVR